MTTLYVFFVLGLLIFVWRRRTYRSKCCMLVYPVQNIGVRLRPDLCSATYLYLDNVLFVQLGTVHIISELNCELH